MDLKLTNKTAIVTAASRGLGKAIATELAREGAHVFLSSRNEQTLHQTVENIKTKTNNPQVSYVTCDLTKKSDIEHLVDEALKSTGRIDVLINNSGGPPAGEFLAMTDQDWQNAFELNLLSYVRLMRAVIPHMQKNGFGRIVSNTSSSNKRLINLSCQIPCDLVS